MNVRTRLVLILVVFLGVPGWAASAEFRRAVDLEWEPVEGSPYYEIEISKHSGGGKKKDPQIFKVKVAMWNGRLKPGQYEMRLRSFDERFVPGDWSDPSLFWVKLPPPNPMLPAVDAEFKAPDADESEIGFSWTPVAGAKKYKLEVKNIKGTITKSEVVSDSNAKLDLKVAEAYLWRVAALLPDDDQGDPGENWRRFLVVGKDLETPKIAVPSSEFIREVKWEEAKFADKYEYELERKDVDGMWKSIDKGMTKTPEVKLKQKYQGGMYRLKVKAQALARAPSRESLVEFKLYDGDRSPAAIKEAQMREAIEKPTNWYSIFSYFITKIDYYGTNREINKVAKYDALGGTGRIGVGYIFPKSSWGLFGIVDMSGFVIGPQNFTFASSELHLVWRTYLGPRTQTRVSGGLFYKELPETKPLGADDTYTLNKLSGIGPHVGFDIWQPMSMTMGLQLNGRIYYNAAGLDVPSGQSFVPNVSYQAGLLGSLKLSRNITGFAGYAYRVDTMAYTARVDRSATSPSQANPGDINTVTITGHYLNLLMEMGF